MSKNNGTNPQLSKVSDEFDMALMTAHKIKAIYEKAYMVFPGREDFLKPAMYALLSGTHFLSMSPPGTGKTSIANFFADGMGSGFFKYDMSIESSTDELLGGLDGEAAMQSGKLVRLWNHGMAAPGVAVSYVAEIDKAPLGVLNLMLKWMEERQVFDKETGVLRRIDLHSMFSCANSQIHDAPAVLDRYTLLSVGNYIDKSEDFLAMLLSISPVHGHQDNPCTLEELKNLREMCVKVAKNKSTNATTFVSKLWTEYKHETGAPAISDRNWQRLVIVAAGRAILMGRPQVQPEDFIVGQYILWRDTEFQPRVASWVEKKVKDACAVVSEETLAATAKEMTPLSVTFNDPSEGARMLAVITASFDTLKKSDKIDAAKKRDYQKEYALIKSRVELRMAEISRA